MVRQLTVDFNRVVDGSLIRANARRAARTVLDVGSIIVVGDDDWGIGRAEVVEFGPVARRLDAHLDGRAGPQPESVGRHSAHRDASLTASHPAGHGVVTRPADYVQEHVRLGYAATEHGNQADTVDVAIE